MIRRSWNQIIQYADDSQIATRINKKPIRQILDIFGDGKDIGLFMHSEGKKGPTILVHSNAKGTLPIDLLARLNVVNSVLFLGLDCSICPKHNFIVASIPRKTRSKLSFIASELQKSLFIVYSYCSDFSLLSSTFKSSSMTTASMIESRFQYCIMFCDLDSLYFIYNIHRRVLCALSGLPFRFFGFRTITNPSMNFIPSLEIALDSFCSETYLKICHVLGRPTLFQISLRAAKVVVSQDSPEPPYFPVGTIPRFVKSKVVRKAESFIDFCSSSKIDNSAPVDNIFHKSFLRLTSHRSRKTFLNLSIDRFILSHRAALGLSVDDQSCRLCDNPDAPVESILHLVSDHSTLFTPRTKRKLSAASKREKKLKSKHIHLDSRTSLKVGRAFGAEYRESPLASKPNHRKRARLK